MTALTETRPAALDSTNAAAEARGAPHALRGLAVVLIAAVVSALCLLGLAAAAVAGALSVRSAVLLGCAVWVLLPLAVVGLLAVAALRSEP
jgi:hypothetical protein